MATVVREFELLTHNSVSDMGSELIYPRPYLAGDFVGMYPPRPYFNSPEVSAFPTLPQGVPVLLQSSLALGKESEGLSISLPSPVTPGSLLLLLDIGSDISNPDEPYLMPTGFGQLGVSLNMTGGQNLTNIVVWTRTAQQGDGTTFSAPALPGGKAYHIPFVLLEIGGMWASPSVVFGNMSGGGTAVPGIDLGAVVVIDAAAVADGNPGPPFYSLLQTYQATTWGMNCLYGDGLVPQQPVSDSNAYSGTPYAIITIPAAGLPVPLVSRVQAGSSLPPGLSLDQVTGLVYGTLGGTYGTPATPMAESASISTPSHVGAAATAGVQYYVTNSNVLISVLYTGYSQTDPNLPVISNTLAGATVGSPSVPNTTAIVDVTSNSFVMQYNYLATAAGTDIISLVQGGTVFDTVVVVVSPAALTVTGLISSTSLPATTINSTGATLNPPVTVSGGAPPYTYTLVTNAGPLPRPPSR